MLRIAAAKPTQGAASEWDQWSRRRTAQHQQVGHQVGGEPERDQQRWQQRLPDRVQDSAGEIQLDHDRGKQRQAGESGRRGQAGEHPRGDPTPAAGLQHGTEGERTKEPFGVADHQKVGRRKDREESRCPEGRLLRLIRSRQLVERDRRHHARHVADQQRRQPGGQPDRGQCVDHGRIEREEGDQVASVTAGGVTVRREVEIVGGIPLVPLTAKGGQRIGVGAVSRQGQRDQQSLDQQP